MRSDGTSSGRMDGFLDQLWTAGGSDLLVSAGLEPQIRVNGSLRSLPGVAALTTDDTQALLAEVLTADQLAVFTNRHEYDFSFSWGHEARIRGNAFRQRGSIAMALRLIAYDIPTMKDLDCPAIFETFVALHQGLVLVTGPTGSGKSTTLAAVINQINAERACHIITIEDPIEYVYRHDLAVVNQRQVGIDTESFASALRAALRENPDVLLVGELRDLESIRSALTLAETGHLVFATLHTKDTSHAAARIIDVFPGDEQPQVRVQLAATLTAIVYQQLLPRLDGGMVAAYEVLMANTAVRNLIKDGKTHQLRNCLLQGQREGMNSFEQSLTGLIASGSISYEEGLSRSLHPSDVHRAAHPNVRVPV
jgi:twitching motility protein PilT